MFLRARISPRFFQTARQLRAISAPSLAARTVPKARAVPKNVPQNSPMRGLSYPHQLAVKGTRTLLYEAPSHFWYTFSSFSAAVFCVSYAAFHYYTSVMYPPPGLAWWVPHGFAIICLFMGGMSIYFLTSTARVVRRIEAVPAKLVKAAKTASVTGQTAAGPSPIRIEVSVRRLVPYMAPRRITVLPEEIKLPFRLQAVLQGIYVGGVSPLSTKEQVRLARAELERREEARKKRMENIMTSPFRDAARGFSGAWLQIRRSLTKEGFAKIKVKDETYKLDISQCWALDNGRALDRLVSVRVNEMKDA